MKVDTLLDAELVGIILGDGYVSDRSFSVCGEFENERKYYESRIVHLINEFGKKIDENFREIYPKPIKGKNAIAVVINKKNFVKKLKEELQIKNTSVEKVVPEWIMNSNNERIIRCFLRGISDTDGSIFFRRSYNKNASRFQKKFHHQPRFRISSVDKNLINEIEILCNKISLSPWRQKPYKGKKDKNINYYLVFDKKQDIIRLFEEIELRNSKHVYKYLMWRKFGFYTPKLNIEEIIGLLTRY